MSGIMKKTAMAVVMAITVIGTGVAQDHTTTSTDINTNVCTIEKDSVYVNVEEQASFPGGMQGLMNWLGKNIRYPEKAQKENVQGRVIVTFVIEKDGSITQATVRQSVHPELDEEALRIVNKMPNWIPGKLNGVPVRSYFNVPITFRTQTVDMRKK